MEQFFINFFTEGDISTLDLQSLYHMLTCDNVLRVSREGTVPHPATRSLSRVVALNAQLGHQREV